MHVISNTKGMLPPPQGENDKIWQINLREGGQLDGSLRCGGKIVDGDLVTTLFCSQGKPVVPHALLCFSTSNFYFYFFFPWCFVVYLHIVSPVPLVIRPLLVMKIFNFYSLKYHLVLGNLQHSG